MANAADRQLPQPGWRAEGRKGSGPHGAGLADANGERRLQAECGQSPDSGPDPRGGDVDGSGTTYLQAKTANEVLKAQERRIRLQKLKGELIERARALSLVFRLAREVRDAWVNWPARSSALMAAELGVEPAAMQKALEKHVRAHLDELAEVRPDFR